MNQFYHLEYKLLVAKIVHKFLKFTKLYLHLNAGNASGPGLSQLSCVLHIQQSPHWVTKQKKNPLHYTVNTT